MVGNLVAFFDKNLPLPRKHLHGLFLSSPSFSYTPGERRGTVYGAIYPRPREVPLEVRGTRPTGFSAKRAVGRKKWKGPPGQAEEAPAPSPEWNEQSQLALSAVALVGRCCLSFPTSGNSGNAPP